MTCAGFLLILAAAIAGGAAGLALAELTESDDFGPLEALRRLRRRVDGGPRLQESIFDSVRMLDGGQVPRGGLRRRVDGGPRLQESIFDSVRMLDGGQVPRGGQLICMHNGTPRRFRRTDSRGGPGWMSDTYEGECCPSCGKIIAEKRIY